MPLVRCLCGADVEGRDGEALAQAFLKHTADVHGDLKLSQRRLQDAADAIRRTGGWDGTRASLDGVVEVRPLGPDDERDYIAWFDYEAFPDNPAWASCYCLSYHVNTPPPEWEKRTAKENRADRAEMIRRGDASGVLALAGGRIVGWCNASPRTTLPVLDKTPGFECEDPARTGAIVCYVISPRYRGQGIARKLLDGACDMLRERGFAQVDAYPPKQAASDAGSYHGRLSMYIDAGFTHVRDADRYVVVRKAL